MSSRPIKSIWIETDDVQDAFFPYLFKVCGVEDSHEYITGATKLDNKYLIDKIIEANQICFLSSMIVGSESLKLINGLLKVSTIMGLSGKRIISAGYFLEALNNERKIPHAVAYQQLFAGNTVLELNERCFKRIVYNSEGKYYTLDATFEWEQRKRY